MEQETIYMAIKESRCAICGTEHGKEVKILNEIYQVCVALNTPIPICNLCLEHYPENSIILNLDLTHLSWLILEKRLNQQNVYNRMCKCGCGISFVTARKEKSFASDICRTKYWQNQRKETK